MPVYPGWGLGHSKDSELERGKTVLRLGEKISADYDTMFTLSSVHSSGHFFWLMLYTLRLARFSRALPRTREFPQFLGTGDFHRPVEDSIFNVWTEVLQKLERDISVLKFQGTLWIQV